MEKLVRIYIDSDVPQGRWRVGGVRIAECLDDAALGRELRTVEVGCHDAADARRLREVVAHTEGLGFAGRE